MAKSVVMQATTGGGGLTKHPVSGSIVCSECSHLNAAKQEKFDGLKIYSYMNGSFYMTG